MTINVVCRKDAINKDIYPLALVFTLDRRRKFLGLGISVALEHWIYARIKTCGTATEIYAQCRIEPERWNILRNGGVL